MAFHLDQNAAFAAPAFQAFKQGTEQNIHDLGIINSMDFFDQCKGTQSIQRFTNLIGRILGVFSLSEISC